MSNTLEKISSLRNLPGCNDKNAKMFGWPSWFQYTNVFVVLLSCSILVIWVEEPVYTGLRSMWYRAPSDNNVFFLYYLSRCLTYAEMERMKASDICWNHRGRVTHICVNEKNIIGSHNGLSPPQHQATIWTNAEILLLRNKEKTFREIVSEIHTLSFKKKHLKMLSAMWRHLVSASMCQDTPKTTSRNNNKYSHSLRFDVRGWGLVLVNIINTLMPSLWMDSTWQTTFSNVPSSKKIFEFRFKFYRSSFLRVQLTVFYHRFKYWFDAGQATGMIWTRDGLGYWCIYASLSLNELISIRVTSLAPGAPFTNMV